MHPENITKKLDKIKLISGRSNPELATLISEKLNIKLVNVSIKEFGNTEIGVEIKESIRGFHVFIIQTGSGYNNRSINDHMIELFAIVNDCKLASAKSITLISPCLAYARSDKKDVPRVPIMGSCIVNILTTLGVNRIIAMDLHAGQIQGFSSEPFDNLYGIKLHLNYLRNELFNGLNNEEINKKYIFASPDIGGVKRVEAYAKKLGMKHVIMHKHRDYDKVNTVLNTILVGDAKDVEGKTIIIIDDMIDTLGTMVSAANELKKYNARDVILIATHGIFSGPAFERLNSCDMITRVIVTNTLPQTNNLEKTKKLHVVDTSDLFVTVIKLIITNGSISTLFE